MNVYIPDAEFAGASLIESRPRILAAVYVTDNAGSDATLMFEKAENMRELADQLMGEAVKLERAQAGSAKPAEEVA